jgi:CDP-diacylglycerol--serine O-phosphatidyltransferase
MPIKFNVKGRRPKVFAVLPTLLTLGNAVCGFGSITFAAKWTGYDTTSSLFVAGFLIYMAMVFDALDGATARWANQTSEFGAQLDSLCDAISFGAAPAFLMLEMAQPFGYHPRVLWVAAVLYTLCTVLRLARFNVESEEDHKPGVFCGLPSPAAAAVVASFPIMMFGPQLFSDGASEFATTDLDMWVSRSLPFVTFGVACLMVSNVRYLHVSRWLVRRPQSGPILIKIVFALAIIVAIPRVAIPLLACWYAFSTPAFALWDRYLRRWLGIKPPAPTPTAENGRWVRPNGPQPAPDPKNGEGTESGR